MYNIYYIYIDIKRQEDKFRSFSLPGIHELKVKKKKNKDQQNIYMCQLFYKRK